MIAINTCISIKMLTDGWQIGNFLLFETLFLQRAKTSSVNLGLKTYQEK